MVEPWPRLLGLTAACPPGRYAVVDPIDVFPTQVWAHIVYDLLDGKASCFVRWGVYYAFVWATLRGDGDYPASWGKTHGSVASQHGLLCVVSAAAVAAGHAFEYDLSASARPQLADGDMIHGPCVVAAGVV